MRITVLGFLAIAGAIVAIVLFMAHVSKAQQGQEEPIFV